MDYGSRGITKFDCADSHGVSHQPRAPSAGPRRLCRLRRAVVEHVPPSAKHMETVLHVLDRLKPGRPGNNLKVPLHKLAEHFGRRGVLVVISDFYEEPEAVLDAVSPLRFRGTT